MKIDLKYCAFLCFVLLQGLSDAEAVVRLPAVIGDHMVIQCNMQDSIWGWADADEQVSVYLGRQQKATRAGADGRWRIFLDPIQPGGPFEMRIAGKNSITLHDVLVGEVWVASGQSNMWWPVRFSANAQNETAEANYPNIRLFTVKQAVSDEVLDNVDGEWTAVTPATVPDFSAVAYYFGREIHQHFRVPVGLMNSSWGATPAEAWTSRSALESNLALQPILWNWQKVLLAYPYGWERYQKQLADWKNALAAAKAQGKPAPHRPFPPLGSGHFHTFDPLPDAQNQWTPSGLFNAMIAPLTRFSIRGVIWYQGESNAEPYRALEYRTLFQTLISDWRHAWNEGPVPFLFVQLSNFREQTSLGLYAQPNPLESAWAELRESQAAALALPNTGMVVTIDIGDPANIHPKNKQEVGRRLSSFARTVAYGENVLATGPIYCGVIAEGDRIRVRFDHVGGGLVAKAGALGGFVIAGRDRNFVEADARIEGNAVLVRSPRVPQPVSVRYAWADDPEATLFSREGLPASPFRTDEWSEPGRTSAMVYSH